MRLLHSADWHVKDKGIEEIETCLSFLVDTAREENIDLLVLPGDTFDSQDVRLDSKAAKLVVKTISELSDICPVAIVIGTPSHDGTAAQILAYMRGKHPVHVATVPEQIQMAGVVLTLIPQPTKKFFQSASGIQGSDQEIGQAMSGLFAGFGMLAEEYKGIPHLLVFHGAISGAKMSNSQAVTGQDIEVSLEQMELSRADLNLCGHLHLAQQLGKRTFYSGSIYPNNFGEIHDHGFYIHLIEEAN